MAYLQPAEYAAFGLSADTSDAWVGAASAMIDAHCRRSSLFSTSFTERLRVSRRSRTVQLTYGPVIAIASVQGRYAACAGAEQGWLPACAAAFATPGAWVNVDPATVLVDAVSGEVTLPWNLLGFQFSEVEVNYTAGLAEVPDAVKFACAQIVKNAQTTPGLNVRSSKLDTLQTQYFSDSLMDSQVRAMLRPFVAERLG